MATTTPTTTTSSRALRFYIDQDDDKAVVRAVPVNQAVVSRATHRVTVAETTGEPVATATIEKRADRHHESIRSTRSARIASERMRRLVRRGR
ncbi:MAG: hypothetical protein QM589_17495 [Thermomicrobiales bacterium]